METDQRPDGRRKEKPYRKDDDRVSGKTAPGPRRSATAARLTRRRFPASRRVLSGSKKALLLTKIGKIGGCLPGHSHGPQLPLLKWSAACKDAG